MPSEPANRSRSAKGGTAAVPPEGNTRAGATLLGALAGFVSALVAIATAELVAGLLRDARSPILDVGDRVIDLVPSDVKSLAITWFGTNDKLALLVGICVLLTLFAVLVGVVTFRGHPRWGAAGVGLFAVVGTVAALGSSLSSGPAAVLPSLVGGAAGVGALLWQYRTWTTGAAPLAMVTGSVVTGSVVTGSDAGGSDAGGGGDPSPARTSTRRHALALAGGLTASAAAAIALGRVLGQRFSAAASRAAVVLPRVPKPLPTPGPAYRVEAPGVSKLFTPNPTFYRIDTALTVPQVDLDTWSLRVIGEVDRELEFSYDDLLAEPQIEADITLTCVSYRVGGDLIGNARWQGLRLDDLLERAGVAPEANEVVGRSVDGYTCGFPTAALDGRDALVAIGMNGEPLPLEHGFPARLVVPGLYGYVSATKWLNEIELTRFDRFQQYWVPRGYAERAPIKMASRIDTPAGLARVQPGEVMVAGVAWAQPVGVKAVEVKLDDGPWRPAETAEALNDSTWVQWKWRWEATPGRHSLTVRAIDETGAIQVAERSEPLPDGATGLHQVIVLVDD